MRLDWQKLSLRSHFVIREIPIRNIEATVVLLRYNIAMSDSVSVYYCSFNSTTYVVNSILEVFLTVVISWIACIGGREAGGGSYPPLGHS